jgi:hypothetical protein
VGVKPRSIEVHIEELVLHGFSTVDAPTIAAAVERELARLFAAHGVPESLAGGGARVAIDAGAFERAPGQTPSAVGAGVARSVHEGVARSFREGGPR